MNDTKLLDLVEILTNKLNCSQRNLSTLLNIDKNTISNNADKKIDELTPKTRHKFIFLFILIIRYLPAHDPDAIHQILNMHVYKNYTGETDSALSSIQQLKHEIETLEFIVHSAKDNYEDQIREQLSVKLEDVTQNLLYA
ncbi:MAG: hypothetical protein ACC657_14220 [Thiohalomonadales bacterium]